MSKLVLIKEIDNKGNVFYWSELNKERVTPYTHSEETGIKDFNEFKPVTPTKEIIKTREI